ncbi:MAG: CHAT domain-containing protein, partial [Gemmatimonadota bacterium]
RKRAAQSTVAFGDPYGLPRLIAELVRRDRPGSALELSEQRRAQHLAEALSVHGTNSAAGQGPDVRRLQAAIPDRETAVFVYTMGVGDAPATLVVATRDTIAGFALGPAPTIARLVTSLTRRLEARVDARQVSDQLAALVLQPALPLLARGIRKIAIVPDGALHLVPFDALPTSRNRYLVDDFESSVVPSLAIAAHWWETSPSSTEGVGSLVFGDPAYQRRDWLPFGLSLPSFADRGRALPRLAASGREARRVARLLGNSELVLGHDASEDRLRRATGRQYRALHIAAHAVVDDWSPDRSFIALAATDGNDGAVSIAELATLELRAHLIVLSACRTARGEIIGAEGVESLALPFLEKGSRTVVATTWAVDDRYAATLMDTFYGALVGGQPAGRALREAKLALRKKGVSASEWSAYTLLGDATLRLSSGPR